MKIDIALWNYLEVNIQKDTDLIKMTNFPMRLLEIPDFFPIFNFFNY